MATCFRAIIWIFIIRHWISQKTEDDHLGILAPKQRANIDKEIIDVGIIAV